ncbi:MAG: hypothetical protein JOZ71_07795 [Ktedonobacteraceae bacterium]|nr:hypothetical protein [Ktedonobacteraceae bacterium]
MAGPIPQNRYRALDLAASDPAMVADTMYKGQDQPDRDLCPSAGKAANDRDRPA